MQRQDLVIRSSKITWEDLAKDKLTALVEDCSKHAEKQTIITNTLFQHKICHRTTWTAQLRNFITWNGEERNNPPRNQIDYYISLLEPEAVASSLIPDPMEEQKQTPTTNLSK